MTGENRGEATGRAPAVLAVLALLPVLMLLLNYGKLSLPTAQWDGTALEAAQAVRAGTFGQSPYLIHPPLYLYLLSPLAALPPAALPAAARLFDFACYLLTGWLVFALGRRLADGGQARAAGLAGAALFYLSPLAVQGIFLIDLGDTSLVPLAASLYFLLLASPGGGAGRAAAGALLFALNLWAKFIHSLFLVLAALAEALWDRRAGAPRRNLLVMAAGLGLFLASWAAYAHFSLDPQYRWRPIEYLFGEMLFNFHKQTLSAGPREALLDKALSAARILLWLWPVLALWACGTARSGLGAHPRRYFNFFILVLLAAAFASKGVSNGFPKYHAAILPLLCAFGGAYAVSAAGGSWRPFFPRGVMWAGAGALLVFFCGDPVYTLNYSLKEAVIAGTSVAPVLLRLGLQLLAAAAAPLLVFAALRKSFAGWSAAVLALAAGGLAWQAGLGLLQARQEGFTTYGYGTRGKTEAVAWLAANGGGRPVLAPNEFDWEFRQAGIPLLRTTDFCQMDLRCMLKLIGDPGTGFFVFGPASNTVGQVRRFLALTPAEAGREFSVVRTGDFWIYALGPAAPAEKPLR